MYAEFANDPKVQMLSEVMQRRLVMLFCLERRQQPTSDHEAAFLLRITDEEAEKTRLELIAAGWIAEDWRVIDRRFEVLLSRPPASVWARLRSAVFERDDYTCAYCGQRGGKLECDHVNPVALGGGHDLDNLATACFKCNRSKRDHPLGTWRTYG
jgi:hypothetical protein